MHLKLEIKNFNKTTHLVSKHFGLNHLELSVPQFKPLKLNNKVVAGNKTTIKSVWLTSCLLHC